MPTTINPVYLYFNYGKSQASCLPKLILTVAVALNIQDIVLIDIRF